VALYDEHNTVRHAVVFSSVEATVSAAFFLTLQSNERTI